MARLLLLTVFALSVFGYGIGVGHYNGRRGTSWRRAFGPRVYLRP